MPDRQHLPTLTLDGVGRALSARRRAPGSGQVLTRDAERVAATDELVALVPLRLVELAPVAALVGPWREVPARVQQITARSAAGAVRLLDAALAAHGRDHGYDVGAWRTQACTTACALADALADDPDETRPLYCAVEHSAERLAGVLRALPRDRLGVPRAARRNARWPARGLRRDREQLVSVPEGWLIGRRVTSTLMGNSPSVADESAVASRVRDRQRIRLTLGAWQVIPAARLGTSRRVQTGAAANRDRSALATGTVRMSRRSPAPIMALFTERARERIDETVERWKTRCLLGDESLIFDGRGGVWSEANVVDLRQRFNDNQLAGSAGGGTFQSKWAVQLTGATEEVRLLAAELLLVHFLFASSVKKPKKLEVIRLSLKNTSVELPADSPAIRAMGEAIGGPGIGFNTRRDLQVAYLIDFVVRFKASTPDTRRIARDPWALRDFADDTDWPIREMRHILLHLLRPDEFERISSGTHKREIAAAFRGLLDDDAPADVDERLLLIREELEGYLPDGQHDRRACSTSTAAAARCVGVRRAVATVTAPATSRRLSGRSRSSSTARPARARPCRRGGSPRRSSAGPRSTRGGRSRSSANAEALDALVEQQHLLAAAASRLRLRAVHPRAAPRRRRRPATGPGYLP